MNQPDVRTAWCALVHVRPQLGRDGGLEGGRGAFANVLALATDEIDLRKILTAQMDSLGFFIAELEQVVPYVPHEDDSENVKHCAAHLNSEWPIQFRDFHTYSVDE